MNVVNAAGNFMGSDIVAAGAGLVAKIDSQLASGIDVKSDAEM